MARLKNIPLPGTQEIERARQVHCLLLQYYNMPIWLEQDTPLDELVSTILSQNTNDHNRDIAFLALRARFPTWEKVRDAPPEEVIAAVRVAGLANQKGPRIQTVLRQISAERGNLSLDFLREMPAEDVRAWLLRFKGVGPKTAAIVMQFTLGMPAFPVDTHVYRVTGRLELRPPNLSVEETHLLMEKLFKPEDFGPDHINLIRLGRDICHPHRPACPECPLNKICPYPLKQN